MSTAPRSQAADLAHESQRANSRSKGVEKKERGCMDFKLNK